MGQVVGREFLDGRVVVWRGSDGVARVNSAYCGHMGADLALGDVEGCVLRCELHWDTAPTGLYDVPEFPTVATEEIVSCVFQIEPLPVPPT